MRDHSAQNDQTIETINSNSQQFYLVGTIQLHIKPYILEMAYPSTVYYSATPQIPERIQKPASRSLLSSHCNKALASWGMMSGTKDLSSLNPGPTSKKSTSQSSDGPGGCTSCGNGSVLSIFFASNNMPVFCLKASASLLSCKLFQPKNQIIGTQNQNILIVYAQELKNT